MCVCACVVCTRCYNNYVYMVNVDLHTVKKLSGIHVMVNQSFWHYHLSGLQVLLAREVYRAGILYSACTLQEFEFLLAEEKCLQLVK